MSTSTSVHELTIDIGEIPILVRTESREFARMLEDRYGEFVVPKAPCVVELDVELVEPEIETEQRQGMGSSEPGIEELGYGEEEDAEDLSVRLEAGRWTIERGNYRAEWDPASGRGTVRQSANPYAIDGVLRILHSLILARQHGFLVHAASGVRNGRAFVFAGVSGTGKTTLARLAPPDVILLTDEISYVRAEEEVPGARCQVSGVGSQEPGVGSQELAGSGERGESQIEDSKFQTTSPKPPIASPHCQSPSPESRITSPKSLTPDTWHLTPAFSAFGTPFAGELARIGRKMRAPLAALFLLQQGPENRIEALSDAEAARELLRHVLFFAHDQELVQMVFLTICDFVRRVPVRRLVFTPDARVWELIG